MFGKYYKFVYRPAEPYPKTKIRFSIGCEDNAYAEVDMPVSLIKYFKIIDEEDLYATKEWYAIHLEKQFGVPFLCIEIEEIGDKTR